jgi:SAM-dependent methyltransferase
VTIESLQENRQRPAPNRMTAGCPCCGSSATRVIYEVGPLPVHSCVLLDSSEGARSFPKRRLELAFCDACGFAFNHLFDEAAMRYSSDFEESQHFSKVFNGFSRCLVREIAERCGIEGKRIVEIGCGKGEFLAELCRQGNATGIGIDPAYRADRGRERQLGPVEFLVEPFGPQHHTLNADILLCRHTLEHIAAPGDFVRSLRNLVSGWKDPRVVFETPDFARVLHECAFWDIYYEHCSYFSLGSHARLFRQEGFDIDEVRLAFGDQYIVQYARPARVQQGGVTSAEDDLQAMRALADGFPERVRRTQALWRDRIGAAHDAGQRVVLWGGGSKAVSLLTTLELGPEIVAAVDINPYKQGKFMPGTGHPVLAPDALVELRPDVVIVMNPVYVREVSEELSRLGLRPDVQAL